MPITDTAPGALAARSPAELLARILEIATPHGRVQSIQLSCSPTGPRQVFCILDLKDGDATAAARALGGAALSAHTVAGFLNLADDFDCPRWHLSPPGQNCFECILRPPPA